MQENNYFDVHAHLTDKLYRHDLSQVIARAKKCHLHSIIVNGLETESNRAVLEIAKNFGNIIQPALGIYPTNAVWDLLPKDFPYPVPKINLLEEIEFIRQKSKKNQIVAIGECGLDGYCLSDKTFERQEYIFDKLISIAMEMDKPLIVHSRKREKRLAEILRFRKVQRVNLHCFSGKVKLAKRWAEEEGWWFSIPANAHRNEGFQKMIRELPIQKLLTETDSPYLSPSPGKRNEPSQVIETIQLIAKLKACAIEEIRVQLFKNYQNFLNIVE